MRDSPLEDMKPGTDAKGVNSMQIGVGSPMRAEKTAGGRTRISEAK
jgi:hypothetical protein